MSKSNYVKVDANAFRAADRIWFELSDRHGFDHVIDDVDDETKRELVNRFAVIITSEYE